MLAKNNIHNINGRNRGHYDAKQQTQNNRISDAARVPEFPAGTAETA
ncbi:hypothetical protein PRECH8_04590 [Insulibacter thermoxylanivorax]|uniref:Uncharacterized protein n=1 Tax=Insulibacter thermoxylanivorax TaxID=2749268 RepID=A0A916VEV6_9BACL|nr:hypothetical protein PRECH8_04590 [Insulibacter thermoxylanivorax]